MEIIEPREPTIGRDERGYYARGFFIGTKLNERGWRVRKSVLANKPFVESKALTKDFAIIPEQLFNTESEDGGGHFYSRLQGKARYDELVKGYKDNSHGKITAIYGPFAYPDDPAEFYYDYRIDLNNDKAANALIEHGAKTWVPYSTSVHIWPLAGQDDDITDFDVFGTALVIKGAFGEDSTLKKMCIGSASACHNSLAASANPRAALSCKCDTCQSALAKILSSFIDKSASYFYNMNNPNEQGTGLEAPTGQTNLQIPDKAVAAIPEDKILLSKEEHAALLQKIKEREEDAIKQAEKEKQIADLLKESRDNALARMFPSDIFNEESRSALLDLVKDKKDIKEFEAFLNGLRKNYIPLILEREKSRWKDEASKTNTNADKESEESNKKGKDKAASSFFELSDEPKPEDDKKDEDNKDKPASSNNKKRYNEIFEARTLLMGDY